MKIDKKGNKKAHNSAALAGVELQALESSCEDQHSNRITRFATLKHRAKNQENYLFTLAKFKENYVKDVQNDESIAALKSAQKLNECGNYLLFKNFYTLGEIKLTKIQTCGQHLLCPFCAAIRASRAITRYVQRIDQVLQENRKLKPVLITLTVKNGTDLRERADHLLKSFRTLLERRRTTLKRVGVTMSSARCRAQCTPTKTHTTKRQVNGIHTYTSSHWWIVGLISKNLPSIGIRLQAIHTLWTFAGRKRKGYRLRMCSRRSL